MCRLTVSINMAKRMEENGTRRGQRRRCLSRRSIVSEKQIQEARKRTAGVFCVASPSCMNETNSGVILTLRRQRQQDLEFKD